MSSVPVDEKKERKAISSAGIIFYDDDSYETRMSGKLNDKLFSFMMNRLYRDFANRKGEARRKAKADEREKRRAQE